MELFPSSMSVADILITSFPLGRSCGTDSEYDCTKYNKRLKTNNNIAMLYLAIGVSITTFGKTVNSVREK